MHFSRPAVLTAAVLLSACGASVDSGSSPNATLTMSGSSASEKLVVEDAGRSAAGLSHVITLSTSGVPYAWGNNTYGQLGDGSTEESPVPVSPAGLTRVQWVSAGSFHSVAVHANGSVWTWGGNQFGQLGNGPIGDSASLPQQVKGLTNITAASAGHVHTVALRRDGSVWGWGRYAGFGSTKPVLVRGLSNVRSVAAGGEFNLAVRTNNSVWGWGSNVSGQLGNGARASAVGTPVKTRIEQVVSVAAGYLHALALRKDGTIWAWGSNQFGQVGVSGGGDVYVPRQVAGLPLPVTGASGVKALAAGAYNSAVLYTDGSVWVWGAGGGTAGSSHVPARFDGVSDVVSLAIGNGFVTMVTANGTVFSTGANESGQLGNNTFSGTSVPVQVVGLSGVKYLSLGASTRK